MWTASYEERLVEWADLRAQAAALPLDDALTLVHSWWNTAPIVNNTVHFTDPENWPLPWDLLAQSGYCEVAKCLGIAYTLILVEHPTVHTMFLLQTESSTYVQIKAADAEYMLSDEIGTISSTLSGNILHQIDCNFLSNKLK